MPNASASRFRFIAHALLGDGPFRPQVVASGTGTDVVLSGESVLVRYPRESALKYARRNDVAFYSSPLMRACSRFVGYLSAKKVTRELPHELFKAIADDADGKGSEVDVFWSQFMLHAKARGSMLLQVEMPTSVGANQAQQLADRRVREAIVRSLDVNFFCENFLYGLAKPAIGPFPSTSPRFFAKDVPMYAFDKKKAEALLDEAGYKRGANGQRFSLRLVPAPWGEDIALWATFLQQSLQQH